jgi:photosystem II stability/assembly factor-like uncharacterized protein
MLLRSTRFALVLAVLAVLVPAGTANAASVWSPLTSGTTQTISAIAWPTASTLVFTTTGGQILHETSPGVFAQSTVSPAAPFGFTDIAMSADGTKGVAVGPSATLYHSTDSGATWAPVSPVPTENPACDQPFSSGALADDLYSVQFADASTVYVTGDHEDILKSVDSGAHFTEVNKTNVAGSVACKEMQGGSNVADPFTDTAWIDASHGFLLDRSFGALWATVDGLTTTIPSRKSEALNSFAEAAELSLDKADPTHLWAVSAGTGCGGLCFARSTDGGTSWNAVTYDGHQTALRDISSSGSTVVAVGDLGDIYTSPDGVNFFRQVADAPLTTNNWRATAVFNANTAVVGGAGGALLLTQKANQTPDSTPPTGAISGPTKLATGQFGSYTASAVDNAGGSGIDPNSFTWSIPGQAAQTGTHATFGFSNPGTYSVDVSFRDLAGNAGTATITVKVAAPPPSGSSPVTRHTGGSTVTIFKKVTVSHRKGRYIPVKLATKHPRQFIVTLLSKKGNHALATLTTTLKKGHRTVHLKIPKSVKSGSYKLVVVVLTTGRHSHPVGAKIKQVFVLA